MPLISQIGRRSWTVRLMITGMYLLLISGSILMAYPFLLMLSMSTTGRPDFQEYQLIPSYWHDDEALFRKYMLDHVVHEFPAFLASDSVPVHKAAHWFGKDHWFLPLDIRPGDLREVMEQPAEYRRAMADDLREFIADVCPNEFKRPCALFDADSPFSLLREYYDWLKQRYGDLATVNRLYPDTAEQWDELGVVVEVSHRPPGTSLRERDWREFLETRSPERTGLLDLNYNAFNFFRSHDVPDDYEGHRDEKGRLIRSLITYDDIQAGKLGHQNKVEFYKTSAPARYVLVNTELATNAWREFLVRREIDPATVLTPRIPNTASEAGLWSLFVQGSCPVEALSILNPLDTYRPFLRERYKTIEALNQAYGTSYADFSEAQIPYASFRYDAFLKEKANGLRWKYLTNNLKIVLEFVALHGDALRVTLIYVILAIVGALTVNPLAAYAMSRFRLQETHHVLIFLLATMAFPGEVLMIPNFLLIKEFPLLQIVLIAASIFLFYGLTRAVARKVPVAVSATLALVVTAGLVGWVLPRLAARYHIPISVSLMNTFFALVLPGLANGYSIFLMKGFFDSLPPELYEAGLIDGASEMRMFWQITLPLSKPILAVMALNAFAAAYGAFMHAFLICQDPKMWTFMVFLYEFQQTHAVPLVMASLVVAAIPTLSVFIVCQNIILRGIVIPSFK